MFRRLAKLHNILRIRQLKFFIANSLDPFVSKSRNNILFVVKRNTVFSANHRVMCEYIIKHYNNYKIAVFSPTPIPVSIKKELQTYNIKCFTYFGIPYLLFLWKSGTVFISHSVRDAFIRKRQTDRVIINYWHGATFKKIENLMHNLDSKKKQLIKQNSTIYDYLISSSEADKQLMSASFGLPSEQVLATGLPRYDLLRNKSHYFKFSSNIDQFFNKLFKQHNKVILYAPTFREVSLSPLKQLSEQDLNKLNQYMLEHNHHLLIRPHYYDRTTLGKEYSNITMLSHKEYCESNIILSRASLLIVDYSSIWVDYLITDQPIVFFAQDFDHYIKNERGLHYNKEFLPGSITESIEQLLNAITDNLNADPHSIKRQGVKQHFHDYSKEESCCAALIKSIPELKELS